jgi:signal peptidase I
MYHENNRKGILYMWKGPPVSAKSFDSTLITVVLVVIVAILLRFFVADAAIVQGRSMLPHYRNGEVVFIFKAAYGIRLPSGRYIVHWGCPVRGEVVAALRPDKKETVIKRIGEIREQQSIPSYFLIGDNGIESIDSRDFGLVSFDALVGKVIPQR